MTIKSISPHDLHHRMKLGHNVVLVDIRPIRDFAKGHIPGATFYPLEVFDAKSLIHKASVPFPDQPTIYIICRNGTKSHAACRLLAEEGYEYIVMVEGGMQAWKAAGLPLNVINTPIAAQPPVSLRQQIQIALGLLVTVGTLLGTFVNMGFLAITMIAGVGSLYEGIFGTDYLKQILLKMSWNREIVS